MHIKNIRALLNKSKNYQAQQVGCYWEPKEDNEGNSLKGA